MLENLALVIEDDRKVSELVALAVEKALGCRVITAGNGEIGLYEARTHKPDLILLDWIMPEMSGMEVLDELMSDPVTATIPVHMITGKTTLKDAKKAREMGASGYFMKPIEFVDLCNWLKDQFPSLAETVNDRKPETT